MSNVHTSAKESRSHPALNLKHRIDAVSRHLAGEDAESIAADLGVPAKKIEQWTKEFYRAGEIRLRQMPDNVLERCLTGVEKLVPIATLVSVLLGVTLFVQGQRKEAADHARADAMERESRVRDAYASLDDKYLDYLKICLDHPDLDVFDTQIAEPPTAQSQQTRREAMVLSNLQSILERAYLMYSNPRDAFERNQWTAWSNYMKAWSARKNFQAEWEKSKGEFDSNYAAYIDGLIQSAPK